MAGNVNWKVDAASRLKDLAGHVQDLADQLVEGTGQIDLARELVIVEGGIADCRVMIRLGGVDMTLEEFGDLMDPMESDSLLEGD